MEYPELTIVSKNKIKLDRSKKYKQRIDFKPKGLWIGIKDNWLKFWYIDEKMDSLDGLYIYEAIINSNNYTDRKYYRTGKYDKKIFIVRTKEDIEYMSSEYGYKDKEYTIINWDKFSKRYAGIKIVDYIQDTKLKLDNLWYATYDVDSICVWDLNLIENISLWHRTPSKGCLS